jgi:hypothetical protein
MPSSPLHSLALARAIVLLALVAACLGCATPQRMPATVIQARVLDAETGAPVAGAKVDLRYVPPRGGATVAAVATTDAAGNVLLDVPATWLTAEFGAAYFAGGFWRQLAVTAPGYQDGGFSEGPQQGRFERQLNLLELDRTPPPRRNNFGALRSLGNAPHPTKDGQIITTLELLDGPRAGATVRIPMWTGLEKWAGSGQKFYLKVPFEDVEAWYATQGPDSIELKARLRIAILDEPYEPATPSEP